MVAVMGVLLCAVSTAQGPGIIVLFVCVYCVYVCTCTVRRRIKLWRGV